MGGPVTNFALGPESFKLHLLVELETLPPNPRYPIYYIVPSGIVLYGTVSPF